MLDWDTLVMKILPKEKELKMKLTRKILNSECRYDMCVKHPLSTPHLSPDMRKLLRPDSVHIYSVL